MEKFISTYKENFSVYEKHNFSFDKDFIIEMKDLIKPSYVDPDSLIDRVIKQYDNILYTRNKEGRLCSFFTTNYDKIDNDIICNLGLLAVKEEYKGAELVFPLGFRHIEILKEKEKELGKRILCWCTTATISIYRAIMMFYDGYQPKFDGSYDNSGLKAVEKIAKGYKLEYNPSSPFVLRQHAHNTQYSPTEKKRISEIVKKKKKSFFDIFQIDESNGDRLIVVMYSPTDEKFNFLASRMKNCL